MEICMSNGMYIKFDSIFFGYLGIEYGDAERKYKYSSDRDYLTTLIEFRKRLVERKNYFWTDEYENNNYAFIGKIIDNENVEFIIIDSRIYDKYWYDKDDYDPNEYHVINEVMPIDKLVKMLDDIFDAILESKLYPTIYPFGSRTEDIIPYDGPNAITIEEAYEHMDDYIYGDDETERLYNDNLETANNLRVLPTAQKDVDACTKMLRERKYEYYNTWLTDEDRDYIKNKASLN